ncbi:DUF805 domain-containing protein [Flammeovirga yaeyamensis]|uniref:DUF805 domain-containing protein n=1 Tax=Flammeovirga yaeyamensis TaxID=367791 RepID=A0AAX1NAW1_9BACT|nr:DUF805 domain-containing protein [Flammeovirga yaeyamensis]MBB3699457.1 uncharacterized membrane protein YhaH (DUF805 family) [Flammeovirga yaeyamensis]NMF35286.1 DUF805 domain-containing protein [Flammeovirga yaeyamensis]QWG04146.1 DUF805 domain-containing protein [Flammeovirga yaeyamensis]
MEYFIKAFKNYANFSGRARRSEYWFFLLFHLITIFALFALDAFIMNVLEVGFSPFYLLYFLVSIVPSIALIVRRLHDVGKSGWFYFISFIPLIGPIWLIVLFCTDGEYGNNQYGENPKLA